MGGPGVATGAGTHADVTLKLSQLQNLCKRDPEGYKDDYDAQIRRLESELGILALSPSTEPPRLVELIQFAAAVSSSSYKKDSDRIADMLIALLMGGTTTTAATATTTVALMNEMPAAALQLHREIRKTCVSALILMRNKGVLEPLRLMEIFFRLMSVIPDKALREVLYHHLVNDVRNINKKGKRDDKLNRSLQSFLHRVVCTHGTVTSGNSSTDESTDVAAKRATDMVCELYRRRVWTDDRTVAILASAVQSKNTTVMCRAMRFFLGIEEKMARDTRLAQEEAMDGVNRIDYHSHSKKTAARQRHTKRQLKRRKKTLEKKKNFSDGMDDDPVDDRGVDVSKKLYPAMEMLRDPQGLAEAVFKRLKTAGSCKFEVKLLMMNFLTRLVGNHKLLIMPLYSFLVKYLTGHQRESTAILAYTVQACHEHVPPDEVYGLLKTISHNFITERCSEEQMAVGINAARAICGRVPSVMSEEESQESTGSTVMEIEAFCRDLAAFANHRDRSVSIAGKAWTNFVREVHPSLLQGKNRGLKGSALHKAGTKPRRYGEQVVASGVEGADLLAEYEFKKRVASQKRKYHQGEEAESDDDCDDGWEEVEDQEENSDSGDTLDDSDDESAPQLVKLDEYTASSMEFEQVLDVSKMSVEEREKLKQEMSSTRVFTASDFKKMRKLVENEQRARRDPREAARRKRAIARGEDADELSGCSDSSQGDSDEEDDIRITGAVDPSDIMADVKKKRQSKADKLEKIIAGRTKFEAKGRAGGATNVEKARKKNFLMSKFSMEARTKGRGKSKKRERPQKIGQHEAKKRRRKL